MATHSRSFLERLRLFDAYPKTLEDFQIKTFSGATVTLVAGVIMVLLFFSELADFLTPQIDEDLFVDTSRGSKLRINVDVVFYSIPCELLSLDAMDQSGEQQNNIHHSIYKRRLDLDGKPIHDPEKQPFMGNEVIEDVKKIPGNVSETEPYCGSCYGAGKENQCCNLCEDIREAYRKRGWAIPALGGFEQCVKEGRIKNSEDIPKEGCQIYGLLEVNRVGGNFHIAPGKSFQHSHLHVHDVQQYRTSEFDLSHRIRHISFGTNIPGKTNPFDDLEHRMTKGPRKVEYFVKIVPTTYERKDKATLVTNQFSLSQHEKVLNLQGESGLPGIFFNYELSPMMLKYTEKQKSLGHFLTGVCAIIGGVFTVAGLIDAFIYHSSRALQKKMELGKAT